MNTLVSLENYVDFKNSCFFLSIKPIFRSQVLSVFHELFFNSVWHDVGKQEKYSFLEPPRDNFYKTQWAGQGDVSTYQRDICTPAQSVLYVQLSKEYWTLKDRAFLHFAQLYKKWVGFISEVAFYFMYLSLHI